MFFTLKLWCQSRSKMLPEPPQKLPSLAQNSKFATIMAHLEAYVGSSWRSCSPSCLSCSPSWRRHGQQFEAKCHLRANIIEDSPQDASATPSEHPKVQKTKENQRFFSGFHSPAMVPKSIKNAPRTLSEAPKLSPKWQSCR